MFRIFQLLHELKKYKIKWNRTNYAAPFAAIVVVDWPNEGTLEEMEEKVKSEIE